MSGSRMPGMRRLAELVGGLLAGAAVNLVVGLLQQ
jgi:hypothetical protein